MKCTAPRIYALSIADTLCERPTINASTSTARPGAPTTTGGMISNLSNQLKDQGALDRMDEVLKEIPEAEP